ncbi:MAG TPA: serine/threonine-protein kinase [Polyangiaceae bacterium]|nr:serine/threonine-protein kinase [Polyangiaceae bacterium]
MANTSDDQTPPRALSVLTKESLANELPVADETLASAGRIEEQRGATIPVPAGVSTMAEGTLVGGKYELMRLIAGGGMGKVFLARHRELRTQVAVKIMHQHVARNAEHVERFRREALATSRLAHPNIVQVLDFGAVADTFYIVMEYIDGVRLGAWLDDCTAVPPLAQIQPILIQTLDALSVAHEAGIVHRDLKPDNILLVQDALGAHRVKVVDFGLAHFRDRQQNDLTITQPDAVAGTPGYMSPEQSRSLKVTYSTDLYAFGCILTELLQLEPPFVGESVMDVISKHLFSPVPELRRPPEAEPVPPALERLRRELLAKIATQRPVSARAVRARLIDALQTPSTDTSERGSAAALLSREQRIPAWNAQQTPLNSEHTPCTIELFRLHAEAEALGAHCLVGLGALGFEVHDASIEGPLDVSRIALIDAGGEPQSTILAMRRLRASFPTTKFVVCQLNLTTSAVNELIEAGADDVVRAPTSSDILARKIERLARRLARGGRIP